MKILEKILTGKEIKDFDKKWIKRRNENEIGELYRILKQMGLSDKKIASNASLLGMNPKTINKKYQRYVGLLRTDYKDSNSGKEILLKNPSLFATSPNTLESNVQWLADRNISPRYALLLGTKTQTKREKIAWMLREVFDYQSHSKEEKKEIIKRTYKMIKKTPQLIINSIKTLEKSKYDLRERAKNF